MTRSTLLLATALAFCSTSALAQAPGLGGYGTVTSPSVGSYTAPVGTTNVPRTWSNTGPQAREPKPSASTGTPNPPSTVGASRVPGVR